MPRYQRLSKRRKIDRKRPRHRPVVTKEDSSPVLIRPLRVSERRQNASASISSGMCYDSKFGPIYKVAPAILDDLTKVSGIDAKAQSQLHALGLFKLEQLRRLTPDQVHAVQANGIPIEMDKLWQRWRSDVQGTNDNAPNSAKPGTTAEANPTKALPAQALSQLTGVTPQIETALGEQGIRRFFQIARWDADTCRAIAKRLGLPEEQIRDLRWVEQARARG